MRNVLVLGAGQSARFLIHQLLADAEEQEWFVTVGDRDIELAKENVGDHPLGTAIEFDVNDAEMTSSQIERAGVVVNMLPQRHQPALVWACLRHGRHLVSVSYRDRDMTESEQEAQRRGVLFLTEVGLDPGIDLMSATEIIHRVQRAGGVVERFESYGSGVPAPELETNPLRYCLTWNSRNVVMAGESGAQFLEDGKIKILPWHKLFHFPWRKEVEGIGPMEGYPNRDSLSYREVLGLDGVDTLIRGTLRYPGWSEIWARLVELGLPNEHIVIPRLEQRSWAEIVEMFLPWTVAGGTLAERVATYLRISPTGGIMDKLQWLGLFDGEPAGIEGETAADAVIHLLKTRLRLPPGGVDVVILLHEIVARYPDEGGRRERVTSTLVVRGEPDGFTAMAKTVGLPAALAVRLLLAGKLPLTGCWIPTHPAIYEPILAGLRTAGLGFEERIEAVP